MCTEPFRKITLVKTFQKDDTTLAGSGKFARGWHRKRDKEITYNEASRSDCLLGGDHGCRREEGGDQHQHLLHQDHHTHCQDHHCDTNLCRQNHQPSNIFIKIIILINIIKFTMMQVELMAGGRMSLGWEFKEERLHFTLVSWQIIY